MQRLAMRPRRLERLSAILLMVGLGVVPTPSAHAGSFFLDDQSVSGSGRASAGASTLAEDASSLFYNPANAVDFPTFEITLGSYAAWAKARLENTASDVQTPGTIASGAQFSPTEGGEGGNPLGTSTLMNFAAAVALPDERTWLAFSVSAPFGMSIEYGKGWFGRYGSSETQLRVLDVGPSLAYRVSDRLAVGATLVLRHTSADFRSALPDPLALSGPSVERDGAISVTGDDWGLGFAVGLRADLTERTRLGLAYRSGTRADLSGRARFTGLQGPLRVRNGRVGASTEFGLPDLVFLGCAHQVSQRWTLLAQVNWFDWSDFKAVEVDLDDGTRLVNPQGYHDSYSVALGAEYAWSDRWTLRLGVQLDRTPIDDTLRSARTPDDDRLRLATGLSYQLREHVTLDFAYAHVFVRNSEIDRTDRVFATTPVASTVRTRASAESGADLVGIALRYRF
jgi:long-chain fatty acid transport protein